MEPCYTVAGNPYSGMFASGAIGIARFSLALDPGTDNFTPGLAMKFFIDGMASNNLEVMYSIDGQGTNFDFFANNFSNIIAAPIGVGTNLIGAIFKEATPFPNYLDLDATARTDRTGATADTPSSLPTKSSSSPLPTWPRWHRARTRRSVDFRAWTWR